MIQPHDFIAPALARGYTFWTGVPCSLLTPLINCVGQDERLSYVGATSEGEAVAIAMGAHLAGRRTVVMCQNSGLGNAVNPLSSLNHPFRVPTLLIVTHRGEPGVPDEPQHALMGEVTTKILETLRIPWQRFPEDRPAIARVLTEVDRYQTVQSLPYALVMKRGAVASFPLQSKQQRRPRASATVNGAFSVPPSEWCPRREAIGLVAPLMADALVVATTGKIGRELFEVGHRPGQLYVVGGMGCASGIGLGVSLNQPDRTVVVIDGDGAALMKMGTLATIGHCAPRNLIHLVLDNEAHESTGAQPTVSSTVDFAHVAAACCYRAAFRCDIASSLKQAIVAARRLEGPILIHMKVAIESSTHVGRPTLSPCAVKEQFIAEATRHGTASRA